MTRGSRVLAGIILAFNLSVARAAASENTWDYSVQLSATLRATPAAITLAWPESTDGPASSYRVHRKAPGAPSWGEAKILPGSATSYTDAAIAPGRAYEYRVVKVMPTYSAFGYIQTGIRAPLRDRRGKLVLVVDDTVTTPLGAELRQLEEDLIGDGWRVLRREVPRSASVAAVKSVIQAAYATDPASVRAVYLFGHIAVPYSGHFNPDGHPDHIGAWPADAYYGDMDGVWTDRRVDYTQTLNRDPIDAARISNRPGDGKFDQTQLPSEVELEVGRVDLANMPGRAVWGGPATFPTETELLRNYLRKAHAFRHRLTNPPRRAVLGDYFGLRGGEAFAASGFRNFAPLVGPENIRNLNRDHPGTLGVWIPHLAQHDYLLAYGCGPGHYATIGGLGATGFYHDGSTLEMVRHDVRGVFNLLFGSWLGDWDHEDNFLRAPLATSHGLVAVWSGRPHWFMHPLGLGETVGHVARLTQNNRGLYETRINSAQNRVHIALMGDPALRLHPVAPASNLVGEIAGSHVALTWSASTDSNLLGYHVYRAPGMRGEFTRLTTAPIAATEFIDPRATSDAVYMVRAIKLETTPSGSYENPSQGIFWSSSLADDEEVPVARTPQRSETRMAAAPSAANSTLSLTSAGTNRSSAGAGLPTATSERAAAPPTDHHPSHQTGLDAALAPAGADITASETHAVQ